MRKCWDNVMVPLHALLTRLDDDGLLSEAVEACVLRCAEESGTHDGEQRPKKDNAGHTLRGA